MIRLSRRDFVRHLALPGVLYAVLFFGGSEIIEHLLLNRVDETIIHFLHFLRGLLSVFFVAFLVLFSLTRVQKKFQHRMEAVCELLNAADQGLIALNSASEIVSWNERARLLLGPADSENFKRWIRMVRESLDGKNQLEVSTPDGKGHLRIVALQSQQEEILLLLQDIAREKKMEERWLIAEKMASIGRMAAGIAHEIGTPLNIISGRAELIQTAQESLCKDCDVKPQCTIEKHIDVIFQQIERITRIMQQLLNQARQSSLQKEHFSLNECFLRVSDLLQPQLAKKNIQLVHNLQNDLPGLFGYADQFQQVLINLLTNAIDAIEGPHGSIEVTTSSIDGQVLFSVRDNGCGIPGINLTKVFDPFFTTKKFGEGTGLGLTVTLNIVEAHSGTIDVQSFPARGTEVIVHLPLPGPLNN